MCNSNFDFILYYNLLLCVIELEMHVSLICAIKFCLLTYLMSTAGKSEYAQVLGRYHSPNRVHTKMWPAGRQCTLRPGPEMPNYEENK